MGKTAFVFPGQGSQQVGMASDLAEHFETARRIVEQADEYLGYSLSSIMFQGPEDSLKQTENTQPALVTAGCAAFEVLKERGVQFDFTAGHSLGEYAALVAAGSLTFQEAVEAVHARGKFMEEAVPSGQGAMAAVMGMERETLEEAVKAASTDGETAELANLNAPGQIVISGTAEGVKRAGEEAKAKGAKRVIPLNVSGPFHSSLMKPAADQLAQTLEQKTFKNAEVPVVSNVKAVGETDKDQIKEQLISQVVSPVLWEDSIRYLIDEGVDTFVEIGSGKVLSGLVRKIQRKGIEVHAVFDQESLEAFIEAKGANS
ncbi:ACP S-malonyltransferase [Salsuginibacillus kocurii]|uniref:ACP S-malonyltransferase n=1 Tax=Salsuginibacillus kocurii TaxID=427078 RepID=UPI00036D4523|nr:ACP S-malonyltransferase [Salsuginibacillus kocurii]